MTFNEEILSKIKPSEAEENEISKKTDEFIGKLNSQFKKSRINAGAAVGGSFAKGTTIKKDRYDVDIFAVFEKKYNSEEISGILSRMLDKLKAKGTRLPGSRDYYSIDYGKFKIEVVPVIKISKPSEAENITDLSMLHVNYIKKQIKKRKNLGDEIRLTKALCYANNCYGAESHIKGFSGYCLELLTSYYGGFDRLVKAAAKWKDRIVIDPAKYYNGKNVMTELNEAKLFSPLILIDPVQKDRNAAAALSKEKFDVFIGICKKLAKKKSKSYFERKFIDEDEIRNSAKREKAGLYKVISRSGKIKEDTAGSKLLKLFNLLKLNLEKNGYKVKGKWDFRDKEAKMWFSIKRPGKIIRQGPLIEMKEHVERFKKAYKKTFIKNGRICAYYEPSLKEIFNIGKKQLSEMGISFYNVIKLI